MKHQKKSIKQKKDRNGENKEQRRYNILKKKTKIAEVSPFL